MKRSNKHTFSLGYLGLFSLFPHHPMQKLDKSLLSYLNNASVLMKINPVNGNILFQIYAYIYMHVCLAEILRSVRFLS